ncbi:phage tail tape measure protein [Tropicimonas sp. IMCC34043]|uniref:phage tail tape measure protein n=1 Tax=Tropicimonas sp. IMCC34043 TaxID=2248760 RepID=UPI000E231EDB|nr:phage tail tape measure protein [Tropicimonas sp. IMCC34043]
MGIKDLIFSIVAKDKTGSAFSSVGQKMRETAGMAATAGERIDRLGRKLVKAGAVGSVASAGIFAAFRDSVSLYDVQARAEAKVAQAIKATGGAAGFTADELNKQASALQGITRFGDEAILDGVTAQLLTFKNVSGDTFTRAQTAALDLATTLNGDLKSASIMLGKALNDPVKGLSAMSRAGVTFSEEQTKMVKSLVASGDLLGAQTLILDELASAYGGQAEAARKTGTGALTAFSNMWGDIKEIVGKNIVPMLNGLVAVFEPIVTAIGEADPAVQKFVVTIGALAVAIPPILAAAGALAIGIGAVSSPVLLVVAGAAALAAGLVALWPQISAGAQYVADLWDRMTVLEKAFAPVSLALRGLWDLFAAAFPNIAQIVADTVSTIGEWISGKLDAILGSLGEKVEWVEGKFAWLYDKVVGNSWVPDLIAEIGNSFSELQGNMVKPTDEATERVDTSFSGMLDSVGANLGKLAREGALTWDSFMSEMLSVGQDYAGQIISDVFGQIATGASQALSGVQLGGTTGGNSFLSTITSGVANLASGLLGFDSGGTFTVGGRAGMDRNIAAVRLSEGERVHVEKRGSSGADQRPVYVTIQTPDVQSFRASRAQVGAQLSQAVAAGRRGA